MLDLHTHVLPGIDDGARTLDDSMALLQALAADGVRHVVATPHIYPGVFDNTADTIAPVFERVQQALRSRGLPLTLSWAAEVRICAEALDWLQQRRLPLLCGGHSAEPHVLLELPDATVPVGTEALIGRLRAAGVTPLIAHPERNKAVMERPERLEPLLALGARLQLTAASVLGEFGERAQATAQALLNRGWVHVVASDSHNMRSRPPRMALARAWLQANYGHDVALALTDTHPTRLAGLGEVAVVATSGWAVRDLPAGSTAAPAMDAAPRLRPGDLLDWPGVASPAAGAEPLAAASPLDAAAATGMSQPAPDLDLGSLDAPGLAPTAPATAGTWADAQFDLSSFWATPAPAAPAAQPAAVPEAVPAKAHAAPAPAQPAKPTAASPPPAAPAPRGYSLADFTLLHPAQPATPGGAPYQLPAALPARKRPPPRVGSAVVRATSGLGPLSPGSGEPGGDAPTPPRR